MNILVAVIAGLIALVLGIPEGYSLYLKATDKHYIPGTRYDTALNVLANLETVTVDDFPFRLIRTEAQFRVIAEYFPGWLDICFFVVSKSMPTKRFIQLITESLRDEQNPAIRPRLINHLLYEEAPDV